VTEVHHGPGGVPWPWGSRSRSRPRSLPRRPNLRILTTDYSAHKDGDVNADVVVNILELFNVIVTDSRHVKQLKTGGLYNAVLATEYYGVKNKVIAYLSAVYAATDVITEVISRAASKEFRNASRIRT